MKKTAADVRPVQAEPNNVPGANELAPRREHLWAALVYALATLTVAYPALAGKFLVNPVSDQYKAGYGFREFAAESLRNGDGFPLWNPYLWGGMPYVAAMHGDIFYPTFLLRMILPTDVGMTWGFIIHFFLCGFFAYLFFRAVGVGFWGALLGGIAYMMGGKVGSLVSPGHDGKLFVNALYPLVLWTLTRGIRDEKRWAWGLLALLVGLTMLTPHPQLAQYLLISALAWSIYLLVTGVKAGRFDRNAAFRKVGIAAAAVVLGFALSAIQYLPVREYVSWSPRAQGFGAYEDATSFAWPPEDVFTVYLPEFTGGIEAYWGRNFIKLHSDYIGVIVLMLFGAAFFGLRGDARRKLVWYWTGVIGVTVLWALGSATPFFRIPYYLVPGTKFFRAPDNFLFVGWLGLAMIAGIGLERVAARAVKIKYFLGWAIFALVVAALGITGGLTNVAETMARPERADLVSYGAEAVRMGALRSLLFVLLGVGLFVAFLLGKLALRPLLIAVAVVTIVDLWSVLRGYWEFSEPAAKTYASNAAIDYLKRLEQPARAFITAKDRGEPLDADLNGGLMQHKVAVPAGYHGNHIARYDTLVGGERAERLLESANARRLTNTQYFLTDADLPTNLATKVAGPARDAAGRDVILYKLPDTASYAWVTPIIVKAPDEQVAPTLLDDRFDLRSAALFNPNAQVTAVTVPDQLPAPLPLSVHVDSYAAGRVSMTLSAPSPKGSALVVSENYYPGWSATVDGKPTRVERADYTFMGIELPEGARKVQLLFRSATYERGKAITLVALALSLVLIGWGLVQERRRSA
jgi:hypothetical protein